MHCPLCQANYADCDLRFCSQDGTELEDYSRIEPDADTVRIGKGYDTRPLVGEQGRIDLEVRVQPIAGDLAIHHSNEWAGTKGSSRALEGFSIRLIPEFKDLTSV